MKHKFRVSARIGNTIRATMILAETEEQAIKEGLEKMRKYDNKNYTFYGISLQ